MSVLTKTFVVLLVICSLLLSASVVVFVNRVDDSRKAADAKETRIVEVTKQNAALQVDLADLKKRKADAENTAAGEITQLEGKITALEGKVAEKDVALATATKQKDVDAATANGVADALRSSEAQNASLQKLLGELRDSYDKVVKQFGELNNQITVADNKIRSLQKALDYEQEASAAKDARIKVLEGQVATTPGTPGPGSRGGPTPNVGGEVPDIRGVVRSVDMIAGKKYATISVGSSSNVSKGMKFTAINRQSGEFLGYVTIDNVTPDEAIGQVEGPKVEKVQAGVDVRTQL